jgi:hypothetical protein
MKLIKGAQGSNPDNKISRVNIVQQNPAYPDIAALLLT